MNFKRNRELYFQQDKKYKFLQIQNELTAPKFMVNVIQNKKKQQKLKQQQIRSNLRLYQTKNMSMPEL